MKKVVKRHKKVSRKSDADLIKEHKELSSKFKRLKAKKRLVKESLFSEDSTMEKTDTLVTAVNEVQEDYDTMFETTISFSDKLVYLGTKYDFTKEEFMTLMEVEGDYIS